MAITTMACMLVMQVTDLSYLQRPVPLDCSNELLAGAAVHVQELVYSIVPP